MLRSFAAWLDPKPASLILDVGTGPGLLPAIFTQSGYHTLGVDSSFEMFRNALHPDLLLANVSHLPFQSKTFNLVVASNLLFLLPDPLAALCEMARLIAPDGEIGLLNPSENMNISAATVLADKRGLKDLARKTLLNYAARAEKYFRWSESDLRELLASANLELSDSVTKMGPGLVRFARGRLLSP